MDGFNKRKRIEKIIRYLKNFDQQNDINYQYSHSFEQFDSSDLEKVKNCRNTLIEYQLQWREIIQDFSLDDKIKFFKLLRKSCVKQFSLLKYLLQLNQNDIDQKHLIQENITKTFLYVGKINLKLCSCNYQVKDSLEKGFSQFDKCCKQLKYIEENMLLPNREGIWKTIFHLYYQLGKYFKMKIMFNFSLLKQRDIDQSKKFFFHCEKLLNDLNSSRPNEDEDEDEKHRVKIYKNITVLLFYEKDFQNAFEYIQKAIKITDKRKEEQNFDLLSIKLDVMKCKILISLKLYEESEILLYHISRKADRLLDFENVYVSEQLEHQTCVESYINRSPYQRNDYEIKKFEEYIVKNYVSFLGTKLDVDDKKREFERFKQCEWYENFTKNHKKRKDIFYKLMELSKNVLNISKLGKKMTFKKLEDILLLLLNEKDYKLCNSYCQFFLKNHLNDSNVDNEEKNLFINKIFALSNYKISKNEEKELKLSYLKKSLSIAQDCLEKDKQILDEGIGDNDDIKDFMKSIVFLSKISLNVFLNCEESESIEFRGNCLEIFNKAINFARKNNSKRDVLKILKYYVRFYKKEKNGTLLNEKLKEIEEFSKLKVENEIYLIEFCKIESVPLKKKRNRNNNSKVGKGKSLKKRRFIID